MSRKANFRQQQPQAPKPVSPAPRSMDEIQKVYAELCARAGALQYRITIEKRELDQLNEALENVNSEANARQKLDAEARPAELKKEA